MKNATILFSWERKHLGLKQAKLQLEAGLSQKEFLKTQIASTCKEG